MRPILLISLAIACGGEPPARSPTQRSADSAPAVSALRAGDFTAASQAAGTALALDHGNSQAAAVRAIATYVTAADDLIAALGKVTERADALHYFDHEEGRAIWQQFLTRLDAVDADLAIAAADPAFSLELCIACWDHDWNHNGRSDAGDRRMLEIERDGSGELLPGGDPRRRPTFRFDAGDVQWARAMIAFQRAGAELVLAYRWSELDKLFLGKGAGDVRIQLIDKGRVQRARERILAGVAFAERCRQEYLAETDDDREWVPNPRQHGAMPLPVDEALYTRWAEVLGDVRKLLTSEEGISLREAGAVLVTRPSFPDAYLDVGRMLDDPQDIVLSIHGDLESPAMLEAIARGLLGHGYRTSMRASPLVARLRHMFHEVDHGDDTIERKLRYLFWLN